MKQDLRESSDAFVPLNAKQGVMASLMMHVCDRRLEDDFTLWLKGFETSTMGELMYKR